MTEKNHIDSAINAGLQIGQEMGFNNGKTFILAPAGSKLVDLEKLRDAPSRIRESVQADDAESFIRYWNRFSDENSLVFLDEEDKTVIAKLDYHGPGMARWGSHTITMRVKESREFKKWKGVINHYQDQTELLEFLGDNIADVVEPAHADLLEVVKRFEVKREIIYSNTQKLSNGNVSFTYKEEDSGVTSSFILPKEIVIAVPVYQGDELMTITMEVRYRLREGKVRFLLRVADMDKLREEAFKKTIQTIAARVGEDRVFCGGSSSSNFSD